MSNYNPVNNEWQGYQYPTSNNPKVEVERNSPSLRDNISSSEEMAIKEVSSLYMGKLGMSLFISQFTIGVAHTFFHRFFSRQSLKEHSWQLVALTSVFLATKVEETPKKLDEIITFHFKLENQNVQLGSDTFKTVRSNVLHCERVMLHTLAFEICVTPAQKYVLIIGNAMKTKDPDLQTKPSSLGSNRSSSTLNRKAPPSNFNALINHALSFVNDTEKTTLSLQYPPHYIALASLLLSDKVMSMKLKDQWRSKNPLLSLSDDLEPPSEENLNDICSQMMDVYSLPRGGETAMKHGNISDNDGDSRARKKPRR